MRSKRRPDRLKLLFEPKERDIVGARETASGPGIGAERRSDGAGPETSLRGHGGEPPRRRVLPMVVALITLAGFAGIVWYAYDWGLGQVDTARLPVILADSEPIKSRPESPGGLEVPNQDTLVLNEVVPDPAKPQVERLLPPPETPGRRKRRARPGWRSRYRRSRPRPDRSMSRPGAPRRHLYRRHLYRQRRKARRPKRRPPPRRKSPRRRKSRRKIQPPSLPPPSLPPPNLPPPNLPPRRPRCKRRPGRRAAPTWCNWPRSERAPARGRPGCACSGPIPCSWATRNSRFRRSTSASAASSTGCRPVSSRTGPARAPCAARSRRASRTASW